jgi:hypothetical protein
VRLGDFRALEIFPLFFQALGKLAMTSSKAWEKGGELFQILMDTTKAAAHQKPPYGSATNDTDSIRHRLQRARQGALPDFCRDREALENAGGGLRRDDIGCRATKGGFDEDVPRRFGAGQLRDHGG